MPERAAPHTWIEAHALAFVLECHAAWKGPHVDLPSPPPRIDLAAVKAYLDQLGGQPPYYRFVDSARRYRLVRDTLNRLVAQGALRVDESEDVRLYEPVWPEVI